MKVPRSLCRQPWASCTPSQVPTGREHSRLLIQAVDTRVQCMGHNRCRADITVGMGCPPHVDATGGHPLPQCAPCSTPTGSGHRLGGVQRTRCTKKPMPGRAISYPARRQHPAHSCPVMRGNRMHWGCSRPRGNALWESVDKDLGLNPRPGISGYRDLSRRVWAGSSAVGTSSPGLGLHSILGPAIDFAQFLSARLTLYAPRHVHPLAGSHGTGSGLYTVVSAILRGTRKEVIAAETDFRKKGTRT